MRYAACFEAQIFAFSHTLEEPHRSVSVPSALYCCVDGRHIFPGLPHGIGLGDGKNGRQGSMHVRLSHIRASQRCTNQSLCVYGLCALLHSYACVVLRRLAPGIRWQWAG